MEDTEVNREDPVLELAIVYVLTKSYPQIRARPEAHCTQEGWNPCCGELRGVCSEKEAPGESSDVNGGIEENIESLPHRTHVREELLNGSIGRDYSQ